MEIRKHLDSAKDNFDVIDQCQLITIEKVGPKDTDGSSYLRKVKKLLCKTFQILQSLFHFPMFFHPCIYFYFPILLREAAQILKYLF